MAAWLGPAITAGGSLLSGILGNKASGQLNRDNRMWQDQNYYRGLKDTLGEHGYNRSVDPVHGHGMGVDWEGRQRDYEWSGHAQRQSFEIGKDYGLTPQEIAGSPMSGGAQQSGGGAVLGNQVSAGRQAMAAAQEKAADRQAMLQAETIKSRTQLGSAAIQAGVGLSG